MAKFTSVEEKLIEKIAGDRLCTSLARIREAVEDIWAIDAPRIIQDYTDHGIKHIERLVTYADKLIEAKNSYMQDLSPIETYLLLSGIYLHDIGMQCDVVRFPYVKAKAEEFGADFDIEFKARTANTYSIDEQKAIRTNHHYLTAAWIDYAHETKEETGLGSAVKTIPDNIVDDVIDVCKHHSKLEITDCPPTCKYKTERKQLIAALLRFSDELDVDERRVSIETIKNYSISPYNGFYWYLHNRTIVDFKTSNLILLLVRLHPDDFKEYGSLIEEMFIEEFQKKNHPVLSVLAKNYIPIVIDHESKVVEDKRTEPLPIEILKTLLEMKYESLSEELQNILNKIDKLSHDIVLPQEINWNIFQEIQKEFEDNNIMLSRIDEGEFIAKFIVPDNEEAIQLFESFHEKYRIKLDLFNKEETN
ncbi:MAG: hypothetical protein GY795_44820 [Desulfobacterales bacterium]|nr:hypothetical protein [Desulfobacterales bacterium]